MTAELSIEERVKGITELMPDMFSSGMWASIAHVLAPHCGSAAGAGACSSLNGMLMRFWAADKASDEYRDLFTRASAYWKLRFEQEAANFAFFTNVVSTVECFFFCFFWVGVMLKTPGFTDGRPQDLRLHPEAITKMFESAFPKDRLAGTMRKIVDHEDWKSAKDVRDALSHRGSPAQYIDSNWKEPISALCAPIYVTRSPKDHPKEWGPTDQPLQRTILVHAWLVGATTDLLMSGLQFLHHHLTATSGGQRE